MDEGRDEQRIDDQARGADRDSRICDVKRREFPTEYVDCDEIDNVAKKYSIDNITERPTQHQGQTNC